MTTTSHGTSAKRRSYTLYRQEDGTSAWQKNILSSSPKKKPLNQRKEIISIRHHRKAYLLQNLKCQIEKTQQCVRSGRQEIYSTALPDAHRGQTTTVSSVRNTSRPELSFIEFFLPLPHQVWRFEPHFYSCHTRYLRSCFFFFSNNRVLFNVILPRTSYCTQNIYQHFTKSLSCPL